MTDGIPHDIGIGLDPHIMTIAMTDTVADSVRLAFQNPLMAGGNGSHIIRMKIRVSGLPDQLVRLIAQHLPASRGNIQIATGQIMH